jgi:hypothetical protein
VSISASYIISVYIQLILAFPKLLPRSRESRFPGTYPQSEEESEEETPSLTGKPGFIACESLKHMPKRARGASEDGIVKAQQSRRIKGKVKRPSRRQGKKGSKKEIKRSYMRPSRADVYYL